MTDRSAVGDRDAETDSGVDLDENRLYRALASTRRRRVLYVLLVEEKSSIDKLATVLTGWDSTETGRMATPEDRQQVLVTLQHRHLPRLDEAGLVTFDYEDGTVELGELSQPVVELITRSVEAEQSE